MSFHQKLITWYRIHQRNLPWRNTTNPYYIWLSEIILQQTQVNQGLNYYLNFIKAFPSVRDLAKSPIDEVLKLWQGLGYYSRARNLHASAQIIETKFNGNFPTTYQDIISLRGVGQYTAAAIASFAYNLPYATLDGNVYRFIARYFGIHTPIDTTLGQREFTLLANNLLDTKQPAEHNQAMMEFGALHCTPAAPKCESCPFADSCAALAENTIHILPIKQGKTKIRERFFSYLCIIHQDNTFLHKRSKKDIWQGLYEFPLIETKQHIAPDKLLEHPEVMTLIGQQTAHILEVSDLKKHILSHQRIYAQCITIKIDAVFDKCNAFQKVPITDFESFPVPRLIEILTPAILQKEL